MKQFLLAVTVFAFSAQVFAAVPGDSARGKRLHAAHCAGCHDAGVYTRKDRKITSVAALHEQIGGCSHAAQIKLSVEQQDDLVKYLNDQFYKFK